MNIEQIAINIKDTHGLDISDEAAITFLRHAISKMAIEVCSLQKPCAESQIESLRQQLSEKECQRVNWMMLCKRQSDSAQILIDELRQQLAEKDVELVKWQRRAWEEKSKHLASHAREQQLLEAIGLWIGIASNCSIESGCCHCGDSMDNHSNPFICGHSPVDMADAAVYRAIEKSEKAIATPTDTMALQAYVANAGEVMRRMVLNVVPLPHWDDIQALPTVTMDDLK